MEKLREIFTNIKQLSLKFVGGGCSNICEALNNKITKSATKRLNLETSYDWRVDMSLLEHNEGEIYKAEVFKRLNLPIPESAMEAMKRTTRRSEYNKKRKLDDTTKRAESKEKKKVRGSRIINEEHKYKGGNTPEDESDDESLTRQPQQKKQKIEKKNKESCGCGKSEKTKEACKNLKCSCYIQGKGCNEKCKCGDKCKNKNNNNNNNNSDNNYNNNESKDTNDDEEDWIINVISEELEKMFRENN